MGKIIKDGIQYAGSVSTAKRIKYDNKASGLNANSVQNAIDEIADRPVNNNILINSNFANPVNQRGVTADTWVESSYGIDRWKTYNATIESITNGLTLRPSEITASNPVGGVYQRFEHNGYLSERVTVSAKINGKIYVHTTANPLSAGENSKVFLDDGVFLSVNGTTISSGYAEICVYFKEIRSYTIEWVKAEYGDVATPYVPRLYAEELQLCKRYYQKINCTDSTLYTISGSALHYKKDISVEMRCAGTVNVEGCYLHNGKFANVSYTDFSIVGVVDTSFNSFRLSCTKESHGFTFGDVICLYGEVSIDAEL